MPTPVLVSPAPERVPTASVVVPSELGAKNTIVVLNTVPTIWLE